MSDCLCVWKLLGEDACTCASVSQYNYIDLHLYFLWVYMFIDKEVHVMFSFSLSLPPSSIPHHPLSQPQEGNGHAGTKPSRVVFCGTTNKLFTTGFTRQSDRQYAVWDVSNLSKALTMENIDTGSGVLFPFYDEGTKMVYLAGKVSYAM